MKLITDVMEDHQIDTVKCSACKHYLTVKPILTNLQNGENLCGRCIADSNSLIHNRWLETLIKQYIFPCMYAARGCTITKLFEDISTHETYCTYRTLKCFCSWSGNPIELQIHYEQQHKKLVMKEGDTIIINDDSTSVLFISKACHFFVSCKRNANAYSLLIVAVTNFDLESKAEFTCELPENSLDFRVELNKSLHLPLTEKPLAFILKSEVCVRLIERILNSISCARCSNLMTPPILKCAIGHFVCIECVGYSFNYCDECGHDSNFTCNLELDYIAAACTYSCKWKCGNEFSANEIREHEQACNKRLYQCLEHNYQDFFSPFVVHRNDMSELHTGIFISNKNEITFVGGNEYLHNVVIAENCSFDVTFEYRNLDIIVSICINDLYMVGWFDFAVDLIHAEDPHFAFNKTYKAEKLPAIETYIVTIHPCDTDHFGEDKSFKIIVRLILLNKKDRGARIDVLYKCFKDYRRLLYLTETTSCNK